MGVDSAWEQKKLEARKMIVNRAESQPSAARFVEWRFCFHATFTTCDNSGFLGADFFDFPVSIIFMPSCIAS